MTTTELIQKIKAEIERRMDKHWEGLPNADAPEDDWTHNELCELGAYKELEHLETFLDSLESEKPMQEGLEEEIDACWQSWLSPSNQKEVEGVLPKTEFAMYARHFYELGKQNTIEELLHDRPKDPRMED